MTTSSHQGPTSQNRNPGEVVKLKLEVGLETRHSEPGSKSSSGPAPALTASGAGWEVGSGLDALGSASPASVPGATAALRHLAAWGLPPGYTAL